MKYIVIDDRGEYDFFSEEYETKEEALEAAEEAFGYLTESEKKKIKEFYVLESVNPDTEAENHFDGDFVKKYI